MQVTQLTVKNFRCFEKLVLNFSSPISVIVGKNGSGKSSLLEALHYLCYLRSFRTHIPAELIQFGQDHFFIEANCSTNNGDHKIQVGCTGRKRLVKVDNRSVSSFKDLLTVYRAVTVVEDDLQLIKGGPDGRRTFIDQVIALSDPNFGAVLKKYRAVLSNRNMLLKNGSFSNEEYLLWSTQLHDITHTVQQKRTQFLSHLSSKINILIERYFNADFSVLFEYTPKHDMGCGYEVFNKSLQQSEMRYGRSLFGSHLDDFVIQYKERLSRAFASRGQQKLIVVLLKMAQAELLAEQSGDGSLLLVDDFLTDFDEKRAKILLKGLHEASRGQTIITSPLEGSFLEEVIKGYGGDSIALSQ